MEWLMNTDHLKTNAEHFKKYFPVNNVTYSVFTVSLLHVHKY